MKGINTILMGVIGLILLISIFFSYRMLVLGNPKAYNPQTMATELFYIDNPNAKEMTSAQQMDYEEKGQKAFDAQIASIDANVSSAVTFMIIVFVIAVLLMIAAMLFGTFALNLNKNLLTIISLIGIAALFLIFYASAGTEVLPDYKKALAAYENPGKWVAVAGAATYSFITLLIVAILAVVGGEIFRVVKKSL